jgi:hypothetical protein
MSYLSKRVADKMQSTPSEQQGDCDDSFRCSWESSSGERCCFPGTTTLSNSVGTEEALAKRKWFCRYHAQCSDWQVGDVIVADSKGFVLMTREEEEREFDKYIARENERNLGLYQKPNETKHEYAMRCRDWVNKKTVAAKNRSVGKALHEHLTSKPVRDWARRPGSQQAVDLMFSKPPMYAEIEIARKDGYIEGDRWVPPEDRKSREPGEDDAA